MTHDEAVAALESLPEVARIEVARLRPSDVLVLEFDGPISQETFARLTDYMKGVWPDHKVVVLGERLKLKVVAADAAPEGA